jgi:hypothetical protein
MHRFFSAVRGFGFVERSPPYRLGVESLALEAPIAFFGLDVDFQEAVLATRAA